MNILFKEYFKIHIIEYHANQEIDFPKISSYCKDCAIQGFVNQGIASSGEILRCKKSYVLSYNA